MQSSLHLFLVRSPSRQMECAHPSETNVAEDSFFLFERIRPMKKKEKREKGKEKGENAYSINRKARRTETSVCVCGKARLDFAYWEKEEKRGGGKCLRPRHEKGKKREMHHQSAKAKLLSLGGKTKEMSAIFTSIGSDRDNCCASSRSKMDAAYKWRKQIKATAADDGLHMPTKGAENRKTVCESSLRSTPSRLKNTNSFYFDLSLGHRLAKEK